jgi:hypothetical protein
VPVLGGGQDIVTAQEASEHIAGMAQDAPPLTVEGARHMGPIGTASTCNEAMQIHHRNTADHR